MKTLASILALLARIPIIGYIPLLILVALAFAEEDAYRAENGYDD